MSQNVSWLVSQTAVFGHHLSDKQVMQLTQFLDLLLTWNDRINLTAVREPLMIQQRHFLDSVSCVLATGSLNGRSLIDVGTGAGFPGLVLKICFPDLDLTLVESVGKKARFLQTVVDTLSLTSVQILAERAEQVGQSAKHREQYDWAVARSVASLPTLAEYLLPLCRVGGKLLAMKGESAAEEAGTAVSAINILGGGSLNLQSVTLPALPTDEPRRHWLLTVEKVAPTPNQYPRRIGVPKKRPLS